MKNSILSNKRNIALTIVLFIAIIFSFFPIVHSTTPNPGHSFTEVDVNQVTKTGSATLTATETVVLADATTGALTLTLPAASSITPRTIFFIKKIDVALANQVTIDGNGSETVDGSLSITLENRGEGVLLQTDGSNWRILLRNTYDVNSYRMKGSTRNAWYTSAINGTAMTTGAGTVNVLRAIPFIVSEPTTIDQMAINVTTVGAGTATAARVGIYADDGNNYPGALMVDAGQVTNMNATGVKTFTTNLPVTLGQGLYWLAYVHNCNTTAPTMRALAVGSIPPVLGVGATLPTGSSLGWSVSFTYAALPATFPSGGAVITAVPIWAVFVRVSS